jgi:GNAT superfamily N-acetyltransferase
MSVVIRSATVEDAPVIATIVRDLGWFAHLKDESLEEAAARFAKHITMCQADDSHTVSVVEHDGVVVGYSVVHWLPYLMLTGPEGYVSELFVTETARGLGIGSQLLKVIEEEARARGCSRLGLLNSRVRESYERQYYKKQGWTERESVASFILPLIP